MLTLEDRMQGIGASEIGAIVGLSSYATADEVERQKLGLSAGPEQTWSMRWGLLCEPTILRELAEDFAWDVQPNNTTFWHPERWAFATPDAFATVGEERVLIQCKSPSRKRDEQWGPDGSGDAPAYVVAQVLWEMWVIRALGRPVSRAIVAARFGTRAVQQFHIPWDEGRAMWLVEQGRKFWARVQARKRELEAA